MAVDLPAVGAAVGAGVLFAVANNIQSRAAARVPLGTGSLHLARRLVTNRRWLAGGALAAAGLVLQAVALARGGVALSQAILSSGLLVALGIEAVWDGHRLGARRSAGAVLVVVGIVLLVSVGLGVPASGVTFGVRAEVDTVLVLATTVTVAAVASGIATRANATAAVMGLAAGVCFALDAVYLRGVAVYLGDLRSGGSVGLVANLVLFAVASGFGNLAVQRAYQRAPLRVSLPAVSAADPLAAFLLGQFLLGEELRPGPGAGALAWVGITAIVLGVLGTSVSPRHSGAPV